jgi:hypothetical protein
MVAVGEDEDSELDSDSTLDDLVFYPLSSNGLTASVDYYRPTAPTSRQVEERAIDDISRFGEALLTQPSPANAIIPRHYNMQADTLSSCLD